MNPLEAFKYWLQDHLDDLKEACPAKKGDLNELYARVTLAYEQSINKVFDQHNHEVRALTVELSGIQEELQHDIERLEDVAGIIDKITTGVGIATQLAGMLSPALPH